MRLYHPRLPWYIDIFATEPNGITVHNVVQAIWTQLATPIHQRHFYTEELDDAHRGVITAACNERCQGRAELMVRGILQVDFLAEKCVLVGLVKGKNGIWEMKTESDGFAGGGDS
ncbi:hypothetical protein AMATHDRAFT_146663 [Amanita thiersii Skay4041]|uniref:DUF6699 domain-containing protein n=1 Tax=Amanita thiersii Skay4041 TaxID=703135 RepID=A0A2A9NNC9_9AGAR|nr:hypothetical protein AMATHDRAFT_146663 [Amanita thiersii Skay4041]